MDRTVLEVRNEAGHDEPWTWVRTYGEGRVFYTAWGHDGRTWGTEGFQRLVARGIRWTSGDWALTLVPDDPVVEQMDLQVPLPTYERPPAAWNTMSDPVYTAQAALSTESSLRLATLPPGFSVRQFAYEPMIGNIIDFASDASGRLWAVETSDYPNNVLPDGELGNDRVLILEDTDGDCEADDLHVYADGLNLRTTVALVDGGVIVGQAPHVLFLGDAEAGGATAASAAAKGDDVAASREILFTGWPRGDTHGTLSNFRWSFDNRILGSVGYNGYRGTVGGGG